jgi:hypothetical protein
LPYGLTGIRPIISDMSVLPVAKVVSAALVGAASLSAAPHAAAPATRFQLTVRIIDRSGQPAKPIDLQFLNLASGTNIDLGQNTSHKVRPGRYNVAAWIGTGTGNAQTFTLADQVIDVTRNRTITMDARQGRRVRVKLNAPEAVQEVLEFAPIVRGHWAFNPSGIADSLNGGTFAAPAYVVPMKARGMTLYTYTVWEKKGNTATRPSPFRYDIINVYRGGFPAHPTYTVRTSALARISVGVRATDQNQQATLMLSPIGRSGPPLPLNAGTTLGATPARLTSYRSPGYQWQPIVDLTSPSGEIRDNVLNMNPYGRGHFTERYFSAVLAPQAQNGPNATVESRQMQVSAGFSLLGDPLHMGDTDVSSGVTARLRLYSGGRLLASSHGGNLNLRIPAARHWYSLHIDATRTPGATLSTQIHAVWRFSAHGTTGGFAFTPQLYASQLLPGGLNWRNQAAAGVVTPVTLRLYSPYSVTPTLLHVVRAQASSNDGKTWRLVTVRRRGSRYVLSVRDPQHAGFVSLRLYVRDGSGNSESLTVIHAYGVR